MTGRVTGLVRALEAHEIFVFGSNEAGRHGRGAAAIARSWGARHGIPEGIQGKTYAIPTKPKDVRLRLSVARIGHYVDRFLEFAKAHPELTFLVTEIGCGLAGYRAGDIAPLFRNAIEVKNIHLPASFWKVLQG